MTRNVGDGAGGAQATISQGTVQKTRDAVVCPAQEEGRGQQEVEQVAHASGVARQGGRGKGPQDRGQAVTDPGQAERGGAACWWPGGRSGSGLKSRGRLPQGKTKEQPRGPGGRKPVSWLGLGLGLLG